MTQDEFDSALAAMGELSDQKALIDARLRGIALELALPEDTMAELAAMLRRRDGLDTLLDTISSSLAADPSVDALSAALDDEVVDSIYSSRVVRIMPGAQS